MIYELVEGNTKVITALAKDGWVLVNTFPNPYPEPYFYALMSFEHEREDEYDVDGVVGNIKRNEGWDKWQKRSNENARSISGY